MTQGKNWLLIIVILLLLTACSTVRPEPPDVSLQSLELKDFNLSHALLQAELELHNPNGFSLTIRHADYRLKLNDIEISNGRSNTAVDIPAHGRGILTLDLTAAYLDLIRFLNKSSSTQPLEYQLDGTIEIGGFGIFSYPFPIHEQGTIDLQEWLQ
ncbi:LEA type 2 family protein [Geothermobacter hydrogeniphilus]|uniref:Water stress and hypersensitive response domain-containing protein n=1 Tax=Geothermobacter hydrogeniphilus TaxID=1969733 RepID=A0A1X0YEG3_9BACT|nr:LEA type 2 family protein [Geothermobacter hydrogeniphilus]ORJ63601.1 hypothetical protein B5V00_01675 [Geothermobacter hydrogeniphilus]